jgi:uncharacterized protein (TIRG00374 family)
MPPPATASERRRGAGLPTILALAATTLVVTANRRDLPGAVRAGRELRPAWLAFAAALGVAGLLAVVAEHLASQRAVGLRPRLRSLARVALAAKFLNLVAKSGGLAGVAAFRAAVRREGRPDREGDVVAAYLLAAVLDPLAFASVLALAMTVVAIEGRFSGADGMALVVFGGYLGITVVCVAAALRSRRGVRAVYGLPARIAGWLARSGIAPAREREPDHGKADELFEAFANLRRARGALLAPALAALAIDVLGVAQLWAVLCAAGLHPGWTQPLVAYAASTLFGIVGIVPGGLGLVEVSLGAILASFGISIGAVAAVVVVYRLLEFWLPLSVGAMAAHA